MKFERWVNNAIRDESVKLIARHELYAKRLAEETARRRRRFTAEVPAQKVLIPERWGFASGFNPYLVRSRFQSIARSIRPKLLDGSYRPHNPALFEVPKDGVTDMRPVSAFQVADNAVSRIVYSNVWRKNRNLFSAHTYAYRDDRGILDALRFMESDFIEPGRIFVAEYDFTKFFDTIAHDRLWATIESHRLSLTDLEKSVLKAFLEAPKPPAPGETYVETGGPPREVGLPQGTSVSLVLANIAAMPLDRALERLGVGFVRYADDTVIWSRDYGRICEAAEILNDAAVEMGPSIHPQKSDGIRLFLPTEQLRLAEVEAKDKIKYVGHSLSRTGISMGQKSVDRLKARVTGLLRDNLLRALDGGTQNLAQVTGFSDRDYITYVFQLRRYLYGDLSETQIRRYLKGGIPPRKYKGLMSFFPLVDDETQLQSLDRWIASQTWLALRRRATLLLAACGTITLPPPHGLSIGDLARHRHTTSDGTNIDLRLPSVRKASALMRKASNRYGAGSIRSGVDPYDY